MKTITLFIALLLPILNFAANRYWIAGTDSNWNNTANWSTTSGGAGGASVPGVSDVAIFDANGLGNCDLDIAATLGGLTINGYTAILDLDGNVLSITSGDITLTTGTVNDSPTSGELSINTNGITRFNGTTFGAEIDCSSGRIFLNGSEFNGAVSLTKTGAGSDSGSGGNTFNSTVTLCSTAPNHFLTGNTNPDIFNGELTVKNNGTNYIYLGHNSAGNEFNEDVLLESTGTSLGIIICQSAAATSTLATGRTVGITAGGFTSGDLRFYRLIQSGATAQNIITTGTSRIYLDGCTWNAAADFSAPRIYTTNTTYNGVTTLSKTGGSNDSSIGGNVFNDNFTLNNSGTGYFLMGNISADTYAGDVVINNSGSSLVYFADNSVGNNVTGDLTVNQSGAATGIRIARLNGSSITIGGDLTLNLAGTADHSDALADAGILNLTGNLLIDNTSSASSVNIYLANQASSSAMITGTATFINNGTGTTTQRFRIAESGTVTFNGIVTATNNCSATNSEMYFNRSTTGVSNFNENIIIESTVAGSDGVSFGENGGSATLAATKTITIGGSGYQSGNTYLRNFTQIGATAQSLDLTGTAYALIYESSWGGDVDFRSPRINTRGTVYSGTSYLEKKDVSDDNSAGGNTFVGNCTLVNSSVNRFGMGNGNPDDFQSNLTVDNNGGGRFELAMNSAGNTIAGDFTLTNSGASTIISLSNNSASTLDVTGNTILTNNSSVASSVFYVGQSGSVNFVGTFTLNNNASGATHNTYIASGTTSSCTFNGTTNINNAGTGGTTQRIWLGNSGDIISNGDLTIANSSGADNSEIFCNYNPTSSGSYNENIIVTNTHADGDGVRFCQNNGDATLAATKTITIGAGGFVSGELILRNFTQIGPTSQSLTCTGTSRLRSIDSDWGGNITFIAPRILTDRSRYNGTASIEKTGGISNDQSVGGNVFVGDLTLRNTGAEYILMGNSLPDTCEANLTLDNASSAEMYWAHNSAGNSVAGDITVTTSNSATRLEICAGSNATLDAAGNLSVVNTSSAPNSVILANSGDIVLGGDLDMTDNGSGTSSGFYIANSTAGSFIVDGNTTIINNSTVTTEGRYYIGGNGDVTFNGTLSVSNHNGAANSTIYLNNGASSTGLYNDNIILEVTNASGDGIRFGDGNGVGTLAATKTVSIGVGGFVSGELRFRNFTQLGSTSQNIVVTGTALLRIMDSNWGGDVDFKGTRLLTNGTRYNGTSIIEKTGGLTNDQSAGGNVFVGDLTLRNTGSEYILMGNGLPDTCEANLILDNASSAELYWAHNSLGNVVEGNLTGTLSNTATRLEVCAGSGADLTVSGDIAVTNTSSASSVILLANSGDITANGQLTVTDNSTGTSSRFYIANATSSSFVIDGNTSITNNSTSTGDSRYYIGSNGDVTFNGTLSISNHNGATNSAVYLNNGTPSTGIYNDNIILEVTHVNGDGIRFGEGNGFATLAATKTVTLGPGGFIAGDLRFRNFTQVGATDQFITATGTARIYNQDSNWGGNITFVAPRILTNGTTYNLTSYLEKTGTTDDGSAGGNLFMGDCQLVNSGTRYFLMGNGSPDIWQGNLSVLNSGSHNMYIAHSSAGNTIAGTLDWTHNGNAVSSYLATSTGSDLTVSGAATFSNTSNASSGVYIGNSGTVTFESTLDATNTPTAAGTGQIRIAEGTTSTVNITGAVNLTNNGSATTSQIIVGNNGDANFDSTLDMINAGSGTNSYFYLGNSANSAIVVDGDLTLDQSGAILRTRTYLGNVSTNTYNGNIAITNSASSGSSEVYMNRVTGAVGNYNGNITVTSEHASCDGVRFGESGGTGTLADGQTVSVGAGGFIAGDLRFQNFVQLGSTVQNIVCTGTARIYQRNAVWNGEATFTAPRYYTNTTTYNDNVNISKTGASSDDSPGGNVFNGTTVITNSGTGRLRWATSTGMPDDYNADVTFVKTNSGTIDPSYQNTDTYSGDINIDINSQIYFGQGGNGRVLLDGTTGDQDIVDIGTSGTPLFRDLQIDKSTGEVNLLTPIEIVTELDLDNGILNSSATNLIYMRDNSTVSSVSDASHVDGPLEKIGNDAFVFPVGDNALYRPITISNPANGSARFRAEYFNEDPNPTYDHYSVDPPIHHISSCEYWTLDRIASSNNVIVTLSWDTPTSCGVTDISQLVVARWDGTTWRDHGNGGTTGNVVSGTVESSAAVTDFSPFTLASLTGANPLPIELVEFNATLIRDEVDLTWTTASETNNDYFVIERSDDGKNFEFLMQVDGAGNSTEELNYKTVDSNPLPGVSYYRLKQVDFNGDFSYSKIKSVNIKTNLEELYAYPNPTSGMVNVILNQNTVDNIQLLNAVGQVIAVEISMIDGMAIIDLSDFENGIYYIKTDRSIVRIIKQ